MPRDFNERPRKNEKDGAITYVQELLKRAREDRRNEDVDKLENLVRLLNTKKYGLVWEEHAELVEEEMKTKIPVFVEDETKKIEGNPDSGDYNFLLEGDNLHSLHLLEKTHAGKIDVIYIDPPYNTGNKDFIYNDKIVDKTDSYSHSKWLSFMSKRLEIARNLLSDSGVIFISIDDNEQAQLKLLCDEIFGETNFLAQFIVENNPKGRKNSNFSSVTSEFCISYSKNSNKAYFQENVPKASVDMRLDDEGNYVHGSGRRVVVGQNNFNNIVTKLSSEKHYSLYYRKSDNDYRFLKEKSIDDIDSNLLNLGFKRYISYRGMNFVENTYTLKKLEELIKARALDFTEEKIYEKNFRSTIRIKNLLVNRKYEAIVDNKKVQYEIDLKTTSAKQQLAQLFGGKSPFDYPKNIGLLKILISLIDNNEAIILDFFAGSGTTGHAVAQLNVEDRGNRKYILCTNNENNICEEVTYKRLANIQEKLPHNLKYLKTNFIVKEEFPDVTLEYELLKYVTPLVELEFGVDITNPKVQVILSEEQLDEMDESDFVDNSTIFFHPEIFFDAKQESILREKNITKQEIPHYYFGKDIWS